MDPKIWGAVVWNLLFDVAHWTQKKYAGNSLEATENDENVDFFFKNVENILPCAACRSHYRQYLEMCCSIKQCSDIGLEFLFPLKNAVNRLLQKKEMSRDTYIAIRNIFPIRSSGESVKNLLALLLDLQSGDLQSTTQWCKKTSILFETILSESNPQQGCADHSLLP